MPLHKKREFRNFLENLGHAGFTLAVHGYVHRCGEFNLSSAILVKNKIKKIEREIKRSGLPISHYFVPPCYSISKEAIRELTESGYVVIMREKIVKQGKIIPISNNEYAVYLYHDMYTPIFPLIGALRAHFHSKLCFLRREKFFISIHPFQEEMKKYKLFYFLVFLIGIERIEDCIKESLGITYKSQREY